MIKSSNVLTLSLNEDVSHGREINVLDIERLPDHVKEKIYADAAKEFKCDPETAKKRVRAIYAGITVDDVGQFSLSGNDPIDGIVMRELESYDKDLEEYIRDSEDIVKLYNDLISARYDEAKKLIEEYNSAKKSGNYKKVEEMENTASVSKDLGAIGQAIDLLQDDRAGLKKEYGMTDAEIKKVVCDAVYGEVDDPEKIKAIINARIHYNNAVTAALRTMLHENYTILGISKDEALAVSGKMISVNQEERHEGVKAAKEIIAKNADKYKIGKTSWDFRPLGLGCVFKTEEDVGPIDADVSIERLVQMLTKYDAIVIGHGDDSNPKLRAYKKKMADDERKDREKILAREDAFRDKRTDEFNKVLDRMKYVSWYDTAEAKDIEKRIQDAADAGNWDEFDQLNDIEHETRVKFETARDKAYEEAEAMLDEMDKRHSASAEAIGDRTYKLLRDVNRTYDEIERGYNSTMKKLKKRGLDKWTIQPTKTLHAGPFEDVNELVHQLIKEGFKNIMLLSCNPGGHSLDKDIINNHDVHVHHATATLMSESVSLTESADPLTIEMNINAIDDRLNGIKHNLISVCESTDLNYDTLDLNECITEYLVANSSYYNGTLSEGVIGTIWSTLLKIIKKAIGVLVALFKKIIELIGKVLGKIKDFFKKIFGSKKGSSKFKRSVSFGSIMVENASLKTIKATTWGEIQDLVVASCNKISKEIDTLEREQVGNLKKFEQYAERNARTTNESANDPAMNKLCAMLY